MPPIPVYNQTPLHPQGITPQTATEENTQNPRPTQTYTEATPTSTSSTYNGPPPPQPGARPPAPTSSSAQPFFSDLPPPAPQAGAHPAPNTLDKPVITETHTITQTSLGDPTAPPAQFSVPAPDNNIGNTPSKSTIYDAGSTYRAPPQPPTASPFETGAGDGPRSGSSRRSLEHPPGYTQNPYAADGTADHRARVEANEQREREEEGMMGQVRGILGSLGQGLQKAEEGVWKAIGGNK